MPFVAQENGRIISSKIEYNLVDYCNLSCDECSHLSPFIATHKQELQTFNSDLNRLAEVYRVRRFRLVGGEPLLNKDIDHFVTAVRESGITREIEIVSNGILVDRISDDVLRDIDYLSISLYPHSKASVQTLERAKSRCRSTKTAFRIDRISRFRRMQVGQAIEDETLVSDIYRSCLITHVMYCQTFYGGNFYLCSRPIFTREYYQRMGIAIEDLRQSDGVPLHEPNLRDRILEALEQTHPLASCRYCLGTAGKYRSWRQMSLAERRNPRPIATAPVADINRLRLWSVLKLRAGVDFVLAKIPSTRLARALNVVVTAITGN